LNNWKKKIEESKIIKKSEKKIRMSDVQWKKKEKKKIRKKWKKGKKRKKDIKNQSFNSTKNFSIKKKNKPNSNKVNLTQTKIPENYQKLTINQRFSSNHSN